MILVRYQRLTSVFAGLSLIYLALSALLPPDKASLVKYKISHGQLVALTFTVTLPYLVIWLIALVGYLRLRSYTDTIARSKDGAAFRVIAWGIFLLAAWLPVSAIIGEVTDWYSRVQPQSAASMIRLNNYSSLIILLVAFVVINQGSKKLLSIIRKSEPAIPQSLMILFIIFSALYVFMVLHDPARQFPTRSVSKASYYLPDWLTITTIIIPRLVTWFFGIQAVHNIYVYRRKVKGPIYSLALDNLAKGIGWVIVMVIVLRCFQSLSSQLNNLSLGVILLLVYALLLLLGVGYVLIAKGAKSLQRIEEV